MAHSPVLVPAEATDLPAILSLLERVALPGDGIGHHLETTIVARSAGRVVGCAALELYGRAALLRSVAVDEASRGSGLGQRMTRAALALARRRGVRKVYLLTTTAGSFFPRFGFRTITRADVEAAVQRSVEFTSVCPDDAQVMQVDLDIVE